MVHRNKVLLASVAFGLATVAFAATPSLESVEHLLAVTSADQAGERVLKQVDEYLDAQFAQVLVGRDDSSEGRILARTFKRERLAEFRLLLRWEILKPAYLEVYSKQLTQAEIDALNQIFDNPVAKAALAKLQGVGNAAEEKALEQVQPQLVQLQVALFSLMKELPKMAEKEGAAKAISAPETGSASGSTAPAPDAVKNPAPVPSP